MHININIFVLIKILLIFIPLVDTFNGMLLRGSNEGGGVGQIYRIFFFCILLYEFLSRINAVKLVTIIFFIFFQVIQFHIPDSDSGLNCVNVMKLFMPIFIAEYFIFKQHEKNDIITDVRSILNYWSFLVPCTIVIPYLLGVGYQTYDGEAGYLGFYFAPNEISFIVAMIVTYQFAKLDYKITWKTVLLVLLNAFCSFLIGTKSGYFVFLLNLFIFLIRFLKKTKKSFAFKCSFFIGLISSFIASYYLLVDNMMGIINRWEYGLNRFPTEGIIFFLTSGRSGRIQDALYVYSNQSIFNKLFGWGMSNEGGISFQGIMTYCEMDFFDIFFSTGIVGLCFIITIYVILFKDVKKNIHVATILFLIFLLSFAGGHILFTGLGGMTLGVISAYVILYRDIA